MCEQGSYLHYRAFNLFSFYFYACAMSVDLNDLLKDLQGPGGGGKSLFDLPMGVTTLEAWPQSRLVWSLSLSMMLLHCAGERSAKQRCACALTMIVRQRAISITGFHYPDSPALAFCLWKVDQA